MFDYASKGVSIDELHFIIENSTTAGYTLVGCNLSFTEVRFTNDQLFPPAVIKP